MKKTMQDSKRWELWERLAPVVLEREEGFGNITVGGATDQQGKDNLLDFIASEISKAREEGRREVLENMRKMWDNDNLGDAPKYGSAGAGLMKRWIRDDINERLSKLTTK